MPLQATGSAPGFSWPPAPYRAYIDELVVGPLSLNFERLDLAADTDLTIFTYAAEPGTRDEEGLNLLASWAATPSPSPAGAA